MSVMQGDDTKTDNLVDLQLIISLHTHHHTKTEQVVQKRLTNLNGFVEAQATVLFQTVQRSKSRTKRIHRNKGRIKT